MQGEALAQIKGLSSIPSHMSLRADTSGNGNYGSDYNCDICECLVQNGSLVKLILTLPLTCMACQVNHDQSQEATVVSQCAQIVQKSQTPNGRMSPIEPINQCSS